MDKQDLISFIHLAVWTRESFRQRKGWEDADRIRKSLAAKFSVEIRDPKGQQPQWRFTFENDPDAELDRNGNRPRWRDLTTSGNIAEIDVIGTIKALLEG